MGRPGRRGVDVGGFREGCLEGVRRDLCEWVHRALLGQQRGRSENGQGFDRVLEGNRARLVTESMQ